jgi:hypothetical protein
VTDGLGRVTVTQYDEWDNVLRESYL